MAPGVPTPSPNTAMNHQLQTPNFASMTTEQLKAMRWQREIYERNRMLSDEELDSLLPGEKEGYKVMEVPANYQPKRDPAMKLAATPTPLVTPGY